MDVSYLLVNFEIQAIKLIYFISVETGPRVLRSCGFVEGESKVRIKKSHGLKTNV